MKFFAIAVLAAVLGACAITINPAEAAVEPMKYKTIAQGGDYDEYHIDP